MAVELPASDWAGWRGFGIVGGAMPASDRLGRVAWLGIVGGLVLVPAGFV